MALIVGGIIGGTGGVSFSADPGRVPDLLEARWIWCASERPGGQSRKAYLRRKFDLSAKPVEATIALTADNGYELFVNTHRVAAEMDS